MKVYITYHNYDNSEYTRWSIMPASTSTESAAKILFTGNQMREFLESGPDDVSSLYLVEADLSDEDFKILLDNYDGDKVFDILQKIDLDPDTKVIYTVNGGDF